MIKEIKLISVKSASCVSIVYHSAWELRPYLQNIVAKLEQYNMFHAEVLVNKYQVRSPSNIFPGILVFSEQPVQHVPLKVFEEIHF
jgi:hypothetical protein